MERTTKKDIEEMICTRKPSLRRESSDLFNSLYDDIVISILTKLCSTARSPSDFISILLTCTRLNQLGCQDVVLREAGMYTVAVRAKNWSDSAHRFLIRCVRAGSNEAAYFLGMIQFYCMQQRKVGMELITKAAIRDHVPSIYSLAIIKFNGSGYSEDQKDLNGACACWARAAKLGHIDSFHELGHCYMYGYRVTQSFVNGSKLMMHATSLEIACAIRASPQHLTCDPQFKELMSLKTVPSANPGLGYAYWTDSGFEVSPREKQPANRFLLEWYEMNGSGQGGGLKLCSDINCGRVETRVNEFRRCNGCRNVKYCSHGCQAHDYKMRHNEECPPMRELVAYNEDHNP